MKFSRNFSPLILIICFFCSSHLNAQSTDSLDFKLIVLGISQDGSYPQVNCQKNCCKSFTDGLSERHYVSSLGIYQSSTNKVWLIDCTPDFPDQMRLLETLVNSKNIEIAGIFLSHAHIGHYLGLAELGREVMGAKNIPVYAMPKMKSFLQNNGPWDQLVKLKNIQIRDLDGSIATLVHDNIEVIPFIVPHRDEYSETVGFRINGPNNNIIFIPDIDKWERWSKNIDEEFNSVDLAFIDGTFYDEKELPGRNMAEIPHPFVTESMKRFEQMELNNKRKIYFIHLNHSNPLHYDNTVIDYVKKQGFNVAKQGRIIDL